MPGRLIAIRAGLKFRIPHSDFACHSFSPLPPSIPESKSSTSRCQSLLNQINLVLYALSTKYPISQNPKECHVLLISRIQNQTLHKHPILISTLRRLAKRIGIEWALERTWFGHIPIHCGDQKLERQGSHATLGFHHYSIQNLAFENLGEDMVWTILDSRR